MIDTGLYIMYALGVISILAAIGLSIMNAAKNPSSFGKSIMGIIGLIVLFVVCYAVSDSIVKPTWVVYGVGEGAVKLVGAGLLTFYIVLFVSILGLIYSEVSKALK